MLVYSTVNPYAFVFEKIQPTHGLSFVLFGQPYNLLLNFCFGWDLNVRKFKGEHR